MKSITLTVVTLFIMIALFVWAENQIAPHFETCTSHFAAQQAENGANQYSDILIALIRSQTICSLQLIDRHNGFFAALAGIAVAAFTFTLWLSTRGLWSVSIKQSDEMKASINEAARAATAMETVSGHLKTNADKIVESVELNKAAMEQQRRLSEMQQRAYLCALIGGGVFQEKEKNLRFEAKPVLRNFGFTPAHKVKWRARAEILPIPIPKDFKFTMPKEVSGSFLLPPQFPVEIFALVGNTVDDEEVTKIKKRDGKALHVWGIVTYLDAFQKKRRMTFHHQIYWYIGADGKEYVGGMYMPTHNKSS